jgi:hypothetical protein
VLAAGVLVVAVGVGLALMLPARGALLRARTEMLAGRDALLAGDTRTAAGAFRRAEGAFEDARARLRNPLTWFASTLPLVGRTPDAVRAGAEAGVLVARAGGEVTGALDDLPGGVAALAPRDGTIPLEPLETVQPSLADARDLVVRAEQILRDTPIRLVPGFVTEPLQTFTVEAGQARRALVAAAAVAEALPRFLGADGPRRYFVGAQNPAELRGTGGLIGSYSVVEADGGRLRFEPFRDVLRLNPEGTPDIEPPNADFAEIYEPYQSTHNWSNVNMTPDVPSAATAIERLYEAVEGEAVDGTILADPIALAHLLRAVGPVDVPGTDVALDADTVVPFVTNEAYSAFTDAPTRKRILGVVAGEVLARFFSGSLTDPVVAGDALVDAAAGGHLLLHAVDPRVQAALDRAGLTGSLAAPDGDFLGVVVNNAGGNKIDFYAERTLRYEVDLRPEGFAVSRMEATFVNRAPTSGQPAYVIGPHPFTSARAGESLMLVSTYCAPGCTITSFDGANQGAARREELRHPVVLAGLSVASGATAELDAGWTVPGTWSGDEYGGTYRLTVRGQPTIRPTRLEVSVGVPEGMTITSTVPGMEVVNGRATWSGTVEDELTLEVEFTRKLFGAL